MEKIIIKYKGYNAELTPMENSRSNYNTMLQVLKGKKLISGTSIKDCTPFKEVIKQIEVLISLE